MNDIAMAQRPQSAKLRTALVLGVVALVFFIGVIIRHWLW